MQDFRNVDDPQPAFNGRSLHTVFASAAAGCGTDQLALASFTLQAGMDGRISMAEAMPVVELWAMQAIYQGCSNARVVLADCLLLQAGGHIGTHREKGLQLFAEAISWLDELAADDHIESASSMEGLLSKFLVAGGTEQERAAVVMLARDMRQWRQERARVDV